MKKTVDAQSKGNLIAIIISVAIALLLALFAYL